MSKAKSQRNKRFKCTDCKCDTSKIGEHYFLHNSVWYKIHNSERGMLCIGCAETRLGRELNKNDFPKVYLNDLKNPAFQRSARLVDRMTK